MLDLNVNVCSEVITMTVLFPVENKTEKKSLFPVEKKMISRITDYCCFLYIFNQAFPTFCI